jgi:FMN phosphatase YigB (HAD superfamily)
LSLSKGSKDETIALYAQFQRVVLREAGIDPDEKLVLAMLGEMQQFKTKLVLLDHVIPTLNDFRNRGLTLGFTSNVEPDLTVTMNELALPSWLDIVVTSLDAGFNKPRPKIFDAEQSTTTDSLPLSQGTPI